MSELDLQKKLIMSNLEILSLIQINDKLLFNNNKFSIDKWAYFQPLYRWYYNESRDTTIKNITSFIETLFTFIDSIYTHSFENNYYIALSKTHQLSQNACDILRDISSELQKSITGLNNLKCTYKNDNNIVSSLEIIIEKIQIRIKKINNSIDPKN